MGVSHPYQLQVPEGVPGGCERACGWLTPKLRRAACGSGTFERTEAGAGRAAPRMWQAFDARAELGGKHVWVCMCVHVRASCTGGKDRQGAGGPCGNSTLQAGRGRWVVNGSCRSEEETACIVCGIHPVKPWPEENYGAPMEPAAWRPGAGG